MQLILISGLSGAGKSVALKVLEDSGYYCVDNLPTDFIAQLLPLYEQYQRIAISIDARSAPMLSALPMVLAHVKQQSDLDLRLFFLDARDSVLIRRYSETRRRHPLCKEGLTLPEAITMERELLADLLPISHRIDTSDLNSRQLTRWIQDLIQADRAPLTLVLESFGFKHGVPLEADFVFDVRCLPNPYYNLQLRHLTGKDAPVAEFLAREPLVNEMFNDIYQFITRWLPRFDGDNRSYLTLAIGCTGGQHRSVYLVERLRAAVAGVLVLHRHRQLPPDLKL